MKALTIKEPWATLIIDGYKKYEFRSWKTNYRGKILIHAGMSEEKDMLKKFKDYNLNCSKGMIIGEALLTDCILVTKEFEEELLKIDKTVYGRESHEMTYAWKLENVIKYDKPIPIKGKLGLWNYEKETMHEMRLNNGPFELIKNGTKTIEIRLNDEKRSLIKEGDIIEFENRATKEKLKTISKQDEPFNFTMLTVDTHFQDGYLCEDCDNKFDEQYKNVIACSSKKVAEFVKWVQEQDFYEDTTIVISGDHLSMQKDFFEIDENSEYEKTVINLFINSFSNTDNTKNRQFSTMDLYPTTLAALGVKIEGERLGLGTNLFSNEKTLLEKYGKEYVDGELRKTSKFYNSNILINNRKG